MNGLKIVNGKETPKNKYPAVTIEVEKQIGHKGYNEDTTDKDIGLMYLKESIKFSKYDGTIVPVCLPTEHLKYYRIIHSFIGIYIK